MTLSIHPLSFLVVALLCAAIGWLVGRRRKSVTQEEIAHEFAEALEKAPIAKEWMQHCYLNGQREQSEQLLSIMVERTTEIANR